jgi:hypothetical protein
MTWDVDKVEAVAAVLAVAVVADRAVWVVPRQPGRAATASAPVAVIKCLTRQDSRAIR